MKSLPSFYLDIPPLDLDRFELDSDDDNDIDMWCDNYETCDYRLNVLFIMLVVHSMRYYN